jgi:hypothetical protein
VLVIDRDDLPANTGYVAALRALGVVVEHARLPGYVEMVLDPHKAQVPTAIVDATVAFAAARPALATPAAAVRPLELSARRTIDGVVEELVAIDGDLVAIATSPATGTALRGVILANAGAVYRVGPNRLYVELARRAAASGALVLRVDLSGLGDSQPRQGAAENVVYSDHAVADLGVLVAWARARGAREVAVVGLCSGAYHAIKVALGHRVDTIVSINPLTFFWKPGMPLDIAAFRVTADAQRYRRSIGDASSWKKLLRGEVDLRRVARVVATRARIVIEHRGRDVLRRLHVPLPDDLGSELRALGRARTKIRFIFSSGEPGRVMLAEQGGSVVLDLERARKLGIDVIDNADHTFTARWTHPVVTAAILRALGISA